MRVPRGGLLRRALEIDLEVPVLPAVGRHAVLADAAALVLPKVIVKPSPSGRIGYSAVVSPVIR